MNTLRRKKRTSEPPSWEGLEAHRKAYQNKRLQEGTESLVEDPKELILTQGMKSLVDAEDFDYLNRFNWVYHKAGYASRMSFFMHRIILGCKDGEHTDHIDRNGLNNKKSNLRKCTHGQNQCNKENWNKWGYKGVWKNSRSGRFAVRIQKDHKQYHFGYFDTPHEAHEKYKIESARIHGEFATF